MPGISVSRIPIPFNKGGFSYSSYWATLISATVETAAPTHVVLTFPAAQTSLVASDFTIAGFTIASGSWTGAVLTLVTSVAVTVFEGDLTITFAKTGETGTVTNNVADDGHTVAWYYSDDLTTITKDANDFVSAWADKLGSGNDLAQATPARQPKWVNNDGITFDGLNANGDLLKTAAIATLEQPTSIYMLIKPLVWSAADYLFDGLTKGTGTVYGDSVSGTPNWKANAGTGSGATPMSLNEWHILRVLFNGASSKLQIDDNVAVTGNFGTNDMGGFTLGCFGNDNTLYCANIAVAEIILRANDDSAGTEEEAIYSYLQKKNELKDNIPQGDTQSMITDDTYYNSFPGITLLPDNRLLVVYGKGTGHASNDRICVGKLSSDYGVTWGDEFTIYDGLANNWRLQDAEVMLLNSTTILLTGFITNTVSLICEVITIRGTISGSTITWGAAAIIDTPFALITATPARALKMANGTLILPVYGTDNNEDKYTCAVTFSTDNGATWGSALRVITEDLVEQYDEAAVIQLPSGRLVMAIRHDASAGVIGYLWAVSDDNGATWTVQTDHFLITTHPGKPTLLYLPKSGGILFIGRAADLPLYMVSWDLGKTWSVPAYLDAEAYSMYESACLLPGQEEIAVVFSDEISATEAKLRYTTLVDTKA